MTRKVTRITFGPGSLEDIELRYRPIPRTLGLQRMARVVGTFRVYCGNGNEHIVPIRSQYQPMRYLSGRVQLTVDTDNFNWDVAQTLVWDELEDWSDPCEAPHTFHVSRLSGTVWCDTCNSPYCELA